jgi:hypothetical protein
MSFPTLNATTLVEWGVYNNAVTGGVFGSFILFLFLIISTFLLVGREASFVRTILGTTAVTVVLAVVFRGMAWIPDQMLFIYISIFLVALAVNIFGRE